MYMKRMKYFQNTLKRNLLFARNVLSESMAVKTKRGLKMTLLFSGILIITVVCMAIVLIVYLIEYLADRL
jgi:hypothetical protein